MAFCIRSFAVLVPFFYGNSKSIERKRRRREEEEREKTQQPNIIIVKTHQYNKLLCTSSTMRTQRERKRMNEYQCEYSRNEARPKYLPCRWATTDNCRRRKMCIYKMDSITHTYTYTKEREMRDTSSLTILSLLIV